MGRPKGSKNGKRVANVPVQYDKAEIPEEIAKELLPKYHPSLVNCNIAFLYKNKSIKQRGKEVVATAKKSGILLKAISDYDFIIIISYEAWNNLSDKQKYFVVDDALEHCFVDTDDSTGETVTKIVNHDFSGFSNVIKRNGILFEDLKIFANAVRELDEE
jgi:hypothetical protein